MSKYISNTINWISSVVIGLNFCPFASKPMLKQSIHYEVLENATVKTTIEALLKAWKHLDENTAIETTFIILPQGFSRFRDYLKLIEKAEASIARNGYKGIYQIASFHPDYSFAGSSPLDAANYTNRSPYAMLHILREASISEAIKNFPNPGTIPQRNIDVAREKGVEAMHKLRAACMLQPSGHKRQ